MEYESSTSPVQGPIVHSHTFIWDPYVVRHIIVIGIVEAKFSRRTTHRLKLKGKEYPLTISTSTATYSPLMDPPMILEEAWESNFQDPGTFYFVQISDTGKILNTLSMIVIPRQGTVSSLDLGLYSDWDVILPRTMVEPSYSAGKKVRFHYYDAVLPAPEEVEPVVESSTIDTFFSQVEEDIPPVAPVGSSVDEFFQRVELLLHEPLPNRDIIEKHASDSIKKELGQITTLSGLLSLRDLPRASREDSKVLTMLLHDVGSSLLTQVMRTTTPVDVDPDLEFRTLSSWHQLDPDYSIEALIKSTNRDGMVNERCLQKYMSSRLLESPVIRRKLTAMIQKWRR